MITDFAIIYLLFLMVAALFAGYLVLKRGLPSARTVLVTALGFLLLPIFLGYLYLSSFASLPEVVVPDVRGMPSAAAQEKLAAIDLSGRIAGSIYEAHYQEGAVAAQRPEPGRRVKQGRIINLMVSSGSRKVIVPNLLGRLLPQAEAVIMAGEFRIGTIRPENNLVAPEGTVLAQEPLPGEEVENGKAIDLLISTTLEVQTEGGMNE
jgi:beta-lactam-binding protein with PASTA domain